MNSLIKETEKALSSIDCLTIYRNIFNERTLANFRELLIMVLGEDPRSLGVYHTLIAELLQKGFDSRRQGKDIFKEHLLETILNDENVFSLSTEKADLKNIDKLILESVRNDLLLLSVIYNFNLDELGSYLKEYHLNSCFTPLLNVLHLTTLWESDGDTKAYPVYYYEKKGQLKELFNSTGNWNSILEELAAYYKDTGSGIFARYWAFKWNGLASPPGLRGIDNPDPIKMNDLVGYRDQQETITRNTEQFVKGLPANNILLYGDRGTGKSSTIKSLVHIFGHQALRIIEVSKSDLLSLPEILAVTRNRAQKFILFIDDLSFEESETEYKELKALLEGSIEKPPANVLLYATSNRRNLVREYFSDREPDEVGKQDTYQEKLSLVDRFGIKILFPTPDKWEYLQTVEELARKSGIEIDRSQLHDLALRWVIWHNSRSGRTARQFINDLKGKIGLKREEGAV